MRRHCRTETSRRQDCIAQHLDEVQRSHRDGRAREPDWSDCTVLAQWRGASRIPRNSRSRTSRSVTRCRSEEGTGKHRNTEFQDCVVPSMQRVQNSLSASTFSRGQPLSWDLDGNSLLQNRASSDTSKVEMVSNSISKTVPRCFLSCEAETARDTHLKVASSLATATIRRRLRYIRTLWKLSGRSWTSPSRCRQELNPQIQEGTQRRRWSTHCRLWTNVEQLCAIIV